MRTKNNQVLRSVLHTQLRNRHDATLYWYFCPNLWKTDIVKETLLNICNFYRGNKKIFSYFHWFSPPKIVWSFYNSQGMILLALLVCRISLKKRCHKPYTWSRIYLTSTAVPFFYFLRYFFLLY